MIEFAVSDATARAHALYFAGPYHRASTQAVLVFERALQDVGNDFHIPVSVGGKTLARRHRVFVDHAQDGETHLTGVVIVGKGKRVVGVEPAVVEMSAILGLAQTDHVLNTPLPQPSSMFAPHPNRCGGCCLVNACSICRHFFAEKMFQLSTLCTVNSAKK